MPLFRLLLVVASLSALTARTLPVRRFEANVIPLGITEDRQGVLWLATGTGLVRFDGLHFEPVHPPAGIDLSTATQIATGPDGSIWIATESGLLRYRNGAFTKERPGEITSLAVTRTGRVLAATAPRRELFICLEAGRTPCKWSSVKSISVAGRMHEDLEGRLWFGCSTKLCSWSDADVKAMSSGIRPDFSVFPNGVADWFDIVAGPDHRLWGRNGPDIVLLRPDGEPIRRTGVPVETFHGARPSFFLDHRGRIWIPGRKLHLVENGVLREVVDTPLDEVTAVFEDARNTLWFGLAGKGLAAIPDEAALETWSELEGIYGSVLDFAVHPTLGLIAATNNGAYIFDPGHKRWLSLGPAADRTPLRSLVVGANGAVLTLPHGRGFAISKPPFRSTRALPLASPLDDSQFRKLYRDPQGTVWVCTLPGLYKLNAQGRMLPVSLPGGRQPSDIEEDAAGQIWVGYEGGIARCSGETCTPEITPKDGLIDPRIRTIAYAAGEFWISYREGDAFTRMRRQQGRWVATHFLPKDGYGPEDTHFLRRDHRGWIWRGSTDGVYVCDGVHTEPEDWLHLSFGERVNASYANMYAFLEQPDGSIWIGTQKGAVHLHPDDTWFKTPPPTVVSVPAISQFHLSQRGLLSFQARLFRYRLLPADSRWRVSTDGIVRYPQLRPGSYRLEVAAGAGRAPVEFAFRVPGGSIFRAPFWIALAMALAGLWTWLIRSRKAADGAARYWAEKRAFLEAREPAENEDWSGRTLDGRFELQERIASGGFAAVYRARDNRNGSDSVAVKLLDPLRDDEEWRRRRFADEVAALQKLDHPGIVRIQHTGEAAADRPYLVMEFVDGITLRELLENGPLEFERAANLLQQIGEALSVAHQADILHRDLKPENIMVCAPGSSEECIKLIDFGIARTQSEQDTRHTTRLAGSPGYLAPERWVGMETQASDIYSLAAIAWEMLTGESYQPGNHTASTLPQPIAELLAAALSYDPQKRPQDSESFVRELRQQIRPITQPRP